MATNLGMEWPILPIAPPILWWQLWHTSLELRDMETGTLIKTSTLGTVFEWDIPKMKGNDVFDPDQLRWADLHAWLWPVATENSRLVTNIPLRPGGIDPTDLEDMELWWLVNLHAWIAGGMMPLDEQGWWCLVIYISNTSQAAWDIIHPQLMPQRLGQLMRPQQYEQGQHPVLRSMLTDVEKEDLLSLPNGNITAEKRDTIRTLLQRLSDRDDYHVPGTTLSLPPEQTENLGALLLQTLDDGLPAALLAHNDARPLATRCEIIAFLVLRSQLRANLLEVDNWWASEHKEEARPHLLDDDDLQDEAAECPSQYVIKHQCTCVKRGIARQLALRIVDAPQLIVTSEASVSEWVQTLKRALVREASPLRPDEVRSRWHHFDAGIDKGLFRSRRSGERARYTTGDDESVSSTCQHIILCVDTDLDKLPRTSRRRVGIDVQGENNNIDNPFTDDHDRRQGSLQLKTSTIVLSDLQSYDCPSLATFLRHQRRLHASSSFTTRHSPPFLLATRPHALQTRPLDLAPLFRHVQLTTRMPGCPAWLEAGQELARGLAALDFVSEQAVRARGGEEALDALIDRYDLIADRLFGRLCVGRFRD